MLEQNLELLYNKHSLGRIFGKDLSSVVTMSSNADPQVDDRCNFIQSVFNKELIDNNELISTKYNDYLQDWYSVEIESLEKDSSTTQHAAQSYKDIISIIQVLSNRRDCCRDCVRSVLLQEFFSDKDIVLVNNSIELALRLWLMLNVRDNKLARPKTKAIQWEDDETLLEFIDRQFPICSEYLILNGSHRVDFGFTVASLRQFRHIDVMWTSSLEDHLRMVYNQQTKKTTLKVFPHKRILIDYLNFRGSSITE